MRVFLLGHRGMLGHVVGHVLSDAGYEVVTTERRYEARPRDPLVEEIRGSGAAWVVNAAGRIKQKSEDPSDLFLANTMLPLQVAAQLGDGQRLIHASTDCVFSGRRGNYAVDDPRDAEDVYGLSKLLGEAVADGENATVIRTSIIGPELRSTEGHGLMAWFLEQKEPVRGYLDHLWNGITTLEWGRICLMVMAGELGDRPGIVQPAAATAVSKFDLLTLLAEVWQHPIQIEPVTTGTPVDRTLRPTLARPDLQQQLQDLRDWYPTSVVAD